MARRAGKSMGLAGAGAGLARLEVLESAFAEDFRSVRQLIREAPKRR